MMTAPSFPTPLLALLLLPGLALQLQAAPTKLVDEAPVEIRPLDGGVLLVDFGKVAFGNLRLLPPDGAAGSITVHFGEASKGGRIDRTPPGTVRYAKAETTLQGGQAVVVAPPADPRNTQQPAAILTPKDWGVVLPFRWVEIEGWQGDLKPGQIRRQAAFAESWDDDAASFESSDPMLNRIWELCRYSIKATTFAGVYVDGDRERIPYEADAYLNQLSHYASDPDVQMARDTFDHLMKHPTWPTEWAPHMVFMAHADWMQTGDAEWLKPRYESLKAKLLMERVGEDGLVRSNAQQIKRDDIVDWPKDERDGYVFTKVNTVVNAFHLAALRKMADLAGAVGKTAEAESYRSRFQTTLAAFQAQLFDESKHHYRDGLGTDHSSLHANLFPLAFGLVPADNVASVRDFLLKRGMACSVYAAQYLMEALFQSGAGDEALALITAKGDRSWRHMVESGTTITWEAWDQRYKPNQDWNHAWGAAPANLFPRFVLGVEPTTPGWKTVRIKPHPGQLTEAKGKVPTPQGPILVHWKRNGSFALKLDLPEGMEARLELPATGPENRIFINKQAVPATRSGNTLLLDAPVSGHVELTVR